MQEGYDPLPKNTVPTLKYGGSLMTFLGYFESKVDLKVNFNQRNNKM